MIDFDTWTISDYAAWWGAIVATIAVVWNLVSAMLSGPRILLRVSKNMQTLPATQQTAGRTFVFVNAVNIGTATTTITHMCGYNAPNFIALLFKRKRKQLIGNEHESLGPLLPHVLRPGEEWSNAFDQEYLEEKFSDGWLYVGVIHNQKKRPVYKRVKLTPNQ